MTGQAVSIWTVRLSLAAFFWFFCLRFSTASNDKHHAQLRSAWTIATLLYLVHVVTAFWFFHDWSHRDAVEHTADVTFEHTGIRWGGGIYFNHAFSLICFVEMLVWWFAAQKVLSRAAWISYAVYAFLLFIMFNASVVFVAGPTRWVSLAGFAILIGVAVVVRTYHRRQLNR